ncbi:hypothetical protein Dimus_006629 [Dionaea muscipula]
MGDHEGWVQPSGVLLNGLVPNVSSSLTGDLDVDRWSKAEEKTAELIARIQPNQPSEERRNAVADYVQRLIKKCIPCQVFTFGSVPLKTYLPDGDIDVSAFSKNETLKETWATQVRDMLESEEKSGNAEFHVKEVQYIQAEVKIIKCLVENIVVDISFNQLGGLCTLCFLEEIDHKINQNHLFKRSIILIKAWCYYESRILGAHHGLISTYALENLVLYIFHVYNKTFAGPLEVLYRFLEFFSNFDWDNFCLSLWGPVPISSLPDVTAIPPRKDSGELLLSKLFLDACSRVYAVFPGGQENEGQGPPFISKHFNVIDPLRVNNNLGRSVSKGNFFRIRSAFAFGAKRLARLLDCPEEDFAFELNQFFMNTWDRHGSGNRPDAPSNSSLRLGPSNLDHLRGSNILSNTSSSKKMNDNSSLQEIAVEGSRSLRHLPNQHASFPQENTSMVVDASSASHAQTQKTHGYMIGSRVSEHTEKSNSNQGLPVDRGQRSSKFNHIVNEAQGKYLFARTRSSPELTDTYSDASPRARHSKPAESGKTQAISTRMDNNRSSKNVVSETMAQGDAASVRHIFPPQTLDVSLDSNSSPNPNSFIDDAGIITMIQEHVPVGAEAMHQEEQDRVNMMASSFHNFGGQVPLPLNFTSQVPMAISPSLMASIGYSQRNLAGMVPANFPLIDPSWASNLQLPPGMIPSPFAQYFPGIGLASDSEDLIEPGNENFSSVEITSAAEADGDFWHERDSGTNGVFGLDDGNMEILSTGDQQPSTSSSSNFVPASRFGGSGGRGRAQQKLTKDHRGFMRQENPENYQHNDSRINDGYPDDSRNLAGYARSSSASQTGSMRSRTSSESSWDGSSAKVSKLTREKRERRLAASPSSSSVYGKGVVSISDHGTAEPDDDNGDWSSSVSTGGAEMAERSMGTQSSAATLHVSRHHLSGFEATQTSGSDSLIPFTPILLGPGSQQRMMDNNSGGVPLTFYPTGPPVPFLTMLPVYNFPHETCNSDASPSHVVAEDDLDHDDPGPGQTYDSPELPGDQENFTTSSTRSTTTTTAAELSEEHKPDILNSDFASHWQNLQYGRYCQNPIVHGPVVYQSPIVAPPVYLQGGRVPWDGPGRPFPTNVNVFSQIMSYGRRLVPVAPIPSLSNRTSSVYQRYADELPRYRSGTGTYLPSPKPSSARERQSSGTRRSNYNNNYDRNEHHVDREGSWTSNPKSRAGGRSSHNRSSRGAAADRLAVNESRAGVADRAWVSNRTEPVPSYSYHEQNGPTLRPTPNSGSTAYGGGMYHQMPGMNQSGGVSSNGPTVPSVVMLYPYEHNPGGGYGGAATTREQLEFGSLGPVGFMGTGMNEASQSQLFEGGGGARMRGAFEEQPRFHGNSIQLSSPEQPSSPCLPR